MNSEVREFLARVDALVGRAGDLFVQWELDWVERVKGRVNHYGSVADWQTDKLKQLEARYSDEYVTESRNFRDNITSEQREAFRLACNYYRKQGYYSGITGIVPESFMSGDSNDYVPSFNNYSRLTDNKYFKKILAAVRSEPKFETGQLVQFRASSSLPQRNPLAKEYALTGFGFGKLAGMYAVVLEVAPFAPRTAANGSKPYKVLVRGKAEPVFVEERFLKKAKKVKV